MKKILVSKWMKGAVIGLLAGVMALGLIASVPGSVYAQSPSPTAAAPQQNTAATRAAALEKAFANENTWLNTQTNNLAKADQLITTAQTLIDQAKVNGKNVGALQVALNAFKAQIANAQSLHDTANRILAGHAGFDASGKVTSAAVALLTVRDARQSLNDAHLVMRQAVIDLRTEIRLFRSAKRNATSPAIPTPTVPAQGG